MAFKTNLKSLIILALGYSAFQTMAAPPQSVPGASNFGAERAPDRIFVRFKPGVSEEQRNAAHAGVQPKNTRSFKVVDGLKLVTLPPGRSVDDAIATYLQNPNVLYAEPDYIINSNATTPNDPRFVDGTLWGLHNTGQSGGTPDADINAPEAWDNSTGSNAVVVSVNDTGVDYNHPDIAANMWVNPGEIANNGIDDDNNGYIDDIHGIDAVYNDSDPMDVHGHGTHVAGTIAGVGNDGVGMNGVVWNAKIIGCKVLGDNGSGATSYNVTCMNYLYDLKTRQNNPVNIVLSNHSLGGGGSSQAMKDVIAAHMEANMLVIAAAGNDSNNNDVTAQYPANYDVANLIAVSATDRNDAMASFSNYGRYSVDIGAPGVSIYSSIPGGSYASWQGTSMATPHVAGLAALIASNDANLQWWQIRNLILAGGTPTVSQNGTTMTGRRIRAWDTDGTGSLTCNNQVVQSLLQPVSSATVTLDPFGKLGVSVININCDQPNGYLTVTTSGGGEAVSTLYLTDDGQGYDQAAGDGIYSGYWTAPASAGTYTLHMPTGETRSVSVSSAQNLNPYASPQVVSETFRTIQNPITAGTIPDGGYQANLNPPFAIKFGDHPTGFNSGYVSTYGAVTFTSEFLGNTNLAVPASAYSKWVFPFWDYTSIASSPAALWSGYNGTSPNREFILEWRQASHKQTGGDITYQVVFFENSSDILFIYQDVVFGNAAYDNGASATIGIQTSGTSGTQYSLNEASVSNGTALLWQTTTNTAPTANAGTDQNVNGMQTVSLTGVGNDADGHALTYQWQQLAGTAVTINNANSASANFTAPNITETLTFLLTVTDSTGMQATDAVNINVTQAPLAEGDIRFTSFAFDALESDGTATVTVERIGSTTGAISVDYQTLATGNAIAGSDYTASSGTITWTSGESGVKSFTVAISDDTAFESLEYIDLSLSNATYGVNITQATTRIRILDNDSLVDFDALSYSAIEQNGSTTIGVKRIGSSNGLLSVSYATGSGSATPGTDFTPASGTLSWADGETGVKTFTINLLADSTYEPGETLELTLSNVVGSASLKRSSTTLQIRDNDKVISFASTGYSVNESGSNVTVTLKRGGSSSGALSVNYATTDISATAGSDYTSAGGTITWADGDMTDKTFSISILNDSVQESVESLSVQLSGVSGGSIKTAEATININDDDDSIIKFSNFAYNGAEGSGPVIVSVSRLGSGVGAVSVNYTTTATGTATVVSDYTAASGTLNWADGDLSNKTFSVSIIDDATYESLEALGISLSNPSSNASLSLSDAIVRIADNDDSFVGFTSYGFSVGEAAGSATITVSRSGNTSGALSIDYATTAGGTATAGSDYTTASGTLSWADGESGNKSFTVSITDDIAQESTETISLQLSNISGSGGFKNSTASIQIQDNDDTLIRFVSSSTLADESTSIATVQVERMGSGSGAVSVDYATIAGGTATLVSDYTAASGTLTWANGETGVKTFTITVVNDTDPEFDETIRMQLSNFVGGGRIWIGEANTVISANDDTRIAFTNFSYTVDEAAGTAVLNVIRSGSGSGAVSVNYSITGGTATSGVDYTNTTGTLSWLDGETGIKAINVPILNDTAYEVSESINYSIALASGSADLIQTSARVVIFDNDSKVGFSGYALQILENAGNAVLVVKRRGNSTGAVSVDYTTQNITAIAGVDYTSSTGTLTWADGDLSDKNISITITNDATPEATEYLRVLLSNATGEAALDISAIRVDIKNDD